MQDAGHGQAWCKMLLDRCVVQDDTGQVCGTRCWSWTGLMQDAGHGQAWCKTLPDRCGARCWSWAGLMQDVSHRQLVQDASHGQGMVQDSTHGEVLCKILDMDRRCVRCYSWTGLLDMGKRIMRKNQVDSFVVVQISSARCFILFSSTQRLNQ